MMNVGCKVPRKLRKAELKAEPTQRAVSSTGRTQALLAHATQTRASQHLSWLLAFVLANTLFSQCQDFPNCDSEVKSSPA